MIVLLLWINRTPVMLCLCLLSHYNIYHTDFLSFFGEIVDRLPLSPVSLSFILYRRYFTEEYHPFLQSSFGILGFSYFLSETCRCCSFCRFLITRSWCVQVWTSLEVKVCILYTVAKLYTWWGMLRGFTMWKEKRTIVPTYLDTFSMHTLLLLAGSR